MDGNFKKIGRLISTTRLQRGLTQAQLAERLGTSQSAINRIEKGNQNISIDLLSRISDVLNKKIISLRSDTVSLQIEGGHELRGSITLKSSKNACMGLLSASLLNRGTTRLKHVARIEEVNRILEVLESIGVSVRWLSGNELEIKPPAQFSLHSLNQTAATKTRSIFMLVGALIHHLPEFSLPHAGGCQLGKRSVLPHIYALEHFGVSIETLSNRYEIRVDQHNKRASPRDIVMYESSDTATENAIFAAALSPGTTTIYMASANYAIQDVCCFLQKLGVVIEGIGTTTLKITGLDAIPKKSVSYSPSEDPIEAMTFIAAAIATNSEITICRVPIDFVRLELYKIEKMGGRFTTSAEYLADNGYTKLVDVTVHKHDGCLRAPLEKIESRPYPGLNIDNLPYFIVICAMAKGESLIHDWTYEERVLLLMEMKKVGVDMQMADIHRVIVRGPTKWRAADLICPPGLRPAVLVLIGMLAAKGTSTLRNIYTINRGYEDIAERFNSLGARITIDNSL